MGSYRISKVQKELNVGLDRMTEVLEENGHKIELTRNSKVTEEQYNILINNFEQDISRKNAAEAVSQRKKEEKEAMRTDRTVDVSTPEVKTEPEVVQEIEEVKPPVEPAPVKEAAPVVEEKPKAVAEVKTVEPEKPTEKPKAKKAEKVEKAEPKKEAKVKVVAKKEAPKKVEKAEAKKEVEKAPVEPAPEEKATKPKKTAKAEKVIKEEETPVVEKQESVDSKEVSGKIKLDGPKTMGKIDLDAFKKKPAKKKAKAEKETPKKVEKAKTVKAEEPAVEVKKETTEVVKVETPVVDAKISTKYAKLEGPKLTGKTIDLSVFNKPKKKVASSTQAPNRDKKKRKRIVKNVPKTAGTSTGGKPPFQNKKKRPDKRKLVPKVELTDEQIQKQIKETLEKLTSGKKKSKSSKIRRDKRLDRREQVEIDERIKEAEKKILKVTEYATPTELANMMGISVTEIISSLMGIGLMVTMNQRLDTETITMVAEEFSFIPEFQDEEVSIAVQEEEDKEEDLETRAPIVTIMGHVDHGKTSLLDYIRKENVIAGEAGGITQHIGAYSVEIKTGERIAFLDTPGHEAFTAMRARGAQVTDIVIIVVAADDGVMPQTKEAISHAQAAGVPIIFAINKVDRPNSNPEKIKEELAQLNLLVEDWGGKIQSQDVSAKTGLGVEELLEKIILESELLDLKANPNKNASGTVVEASLDKGRGYMSTIMVQNGTLNVGDYVLAGPYSGKVKAMLDERGKNLKKALPSTPISLLGLDGAPQAGDNFIVMKDEREAKGIAAKRTQLQREQSTRSQKSLTLEEIGRRLAVGDFQELNIILKGDVDGSIEALSASLQKLSTDEIHVQIVHKGVGQITESDVLLASATGAIIVGFQVRPSGNARKIAEKESVDIRLYSIIYDAIDEVKNAMEGMLSPDFKEEIIGTAEIRETFKISKIGTIAGCMMQEGKIFRSSNIRIIRDGVVVYNGELGSLKRFKDDVKEVAKGYECGLNIKNYNDIKVGDIVEAFENVEVKKTLS